MAEKQVKDYEKFVVRFPDGMRDAIAERAKKNGRSMNAEIVQILDDVINTEVISWDDSLLPKKASETVTMSKAQLDKLISTTVDEVTRVISERYAKKK